MLLKSHDIHFFTKYNILTLLLISAPLSNKYFTILKCPLNDAPYNGVYYIFII
jgi:hypothetical protein